MRSPGPFWTFWTRRRKSFDIEAIIFASKHSGGATSLTTQQNRSPAEAFFLGRLVHLVF